MVTDCALAGVDNNVAKDSTDFRFEADEGGPQVRLTAPDEGDTLEAGETFTLRATADDSEGGIKYVQFFLNDRLLTTKPFTPYELQYAIDDPGTYVIRVVATDLAGNTTDDEALITVTEASPEKDAAGGDATGDDEDGLPAE